MLESHLAHWITLTFDLAFRWAKVRSNSRLNSKSKVISLNKSLSPNFEVCVAIRSVKVLDQNLGLSAYLDRS